MGPKNNSEESSFPALALIVTALILFLFSKNQESKNSTEMQLNSNSNQSSVNRGDVQEIVNRNMRETSLKIEEQQMHGKFLNSRLNRNIRDLTPYTIQEPKSAFPIEPQKKEITQPNNSFGREKTIDYTTPRTVIEMELADKQAENQSKEEFRKEYIRQFVENARKDGWKVDVDSKGNIKNVQQIEKKPTMNIFSPTAEMK